METKFEEENTRLLSKRSNNEDISIHVGDEMEEHPQVSGSDETGVEDKLVKELNRKLDEVHPSPSSKFCIYRVPHNIRKLNEEAYQPLLVSIGPFHHGNVRYKSMEAFKMRSFKNVVDRSRNTGVGVDQYVKFLKDREEIVRQCYSEIIELGSDEFVTMLLLDGCFIIEFLLHHKYSDDSDDSDDDIDEDYYILAETRLMVDILHDLILLENQIPFFVLDGLFRLAMKDFNTDPLLDLAISFFDYFNVQGKSPDDICSIKHFTDLLLIFQRPKSPRPKAEEFHSTKTATALDEAGVKFKMCDSSNCLLDIKFSNGVLEIPLIKLEDRTESLMRNMMALELCHYPDDSYMIDYLVFLDYLVNNPKDVDLLVHRGIIDNWLGDSKQVADLINNMNLNITITSKNFYFSSLCQELNAYCKIPRHKWRAALMRDYLSSPWRVASTSAAIILLVLTLIQTICSLLSAVNGN